MHAYILASPAAGVRGERARRLSAAALCRAAGERPCMRCRDCRKVMEGVHPDVITVSPDIDDKGRIKRDIPVAKIRAIVADAQIKPNEAEAKVYIIEPADAMNTQAQNALLKLLEEPPGSAVFLLCTENPGRLLPTVRSRCALLRLGGEAEPDAEVIEDARGLLRSLSTASRVKILRWCAENEGMDGRRAEAMLRHARDMLADELGGRGEFSISQADCLALYALFTRCLEYLRLNVGVKHVFGVLAVDGAYPQAMK